MARIAKTTRTLNPLPFGDLNPARFEDLARNLIYDLKTWRSIEATGRSGGDDGFDIRAWEGTDVAINRSEDAETEGLHSTNENLWMFQCKRYKTLGPSKIKEIINDCIKRDKTIYGYVLIAPVYFSKASYDMFREELRKRGVMEFHLWGRSAIEDMLFMPKNDHILFAFFGLSLVTKRRSKTSEIKFSINNKNKLLRILSDGNHTDWLHKSVMVRDYKDEKYPWSGEYLDFHKNPRWEEHIVTGYHPLGIVVDVHRYYAYVDISKQKYDYTDVVDLLVKESNRQNSNDTYKKGARVRDYMKYLPRKNQAEITKRGLIRYEDILVIDEKGDNWNNYPHLFVDFQGEKGPFHGFQSVIKMTAYKDEEIVLDGDFKRIKLFPQKFPKEKKCRLHKSKEIVWSEEVRKAFEHDYRSVTLLFDMDGKYSFLHPGDIIKIGGISDSDKPGHLRITYKYETIVKRFLGDDYSTYEREKIELQAGRAVRNNEKMTVLEFERVYGYELQKPHWT